MTHTELNTATMPAASQLVAGATGGHLMTPLAGNEERSGFASTFSGFRAGIPKRMLASITSQLAIMTRSGVDIASAIQTVGRQTRNAKVASVFETIHADVLGGATFSAALAQHPGTFGQTYIATVAAGEASGKMTEVLDQLARLVRSEVRLRHTIRGLLAYPIILMTVATAVVVGLVVFVLPRFAAIFSQFDTPLPFITQVLMAVASFFGNYWIIWVPALLLTVVGLTVFRLSPFGSRCWDSVVLNTFVLREVTRALMIGRVCRLIGLMVESGVPLLDSIRLARTSVRNHLYRELFNDMESDVLNGRGLRDSLTHHRFIPTAAAEMIMTGEQTGSIGRVTRLIGEHFEEEGETRLRELLTLLEPVITVVMGVKVGFVVLAVMIPLFDIATLTRT